MYLNVFGQNRIRFVFFIRFRCDQNERCNNFMSVLLTCIPIYGHNAYIFNSCYFLNQRGVQILYIWNIREIIF